MSASGSRRLARTLGRWAAALVPGSPSHWGAAMRRELEHIDDDRAALSWAAGALWAAGRERAGVLLDTRWAGRVLALFAVLEAYVMLFAPVLIITWRLRWLRLTELLGGQLPGDHYSRFVPLMNATGPWLLALWMAVGLLFLIAAWRVLRNRPGAFAVFAAALLLGVATACMAWVDRQLHPALAQIYRRTYAFARPSWRREYLIPAAQWVLALLVAAVLRWRERPAAPSGV